MISTMSNKRHVNDMEFLYRVEIGQPVASSPGLVKLGGYELASRLSYFLWNGPPDRQTQQLAAAGTLRKQLDAEVSRMIACVPSRSGA